MSPIDRIPTAGLTCDEEAMLAHDVIVGELLCEIEMSEEEVGKNEALHIHLHHTRDWVTRCRQSPQSDV